MAEQLFFACGKINLAIKFLLCFLTLLALLIRAALPMLAREPIRAALLMLPQEPIRAELRTPAPADTPATAHTYQALIRIREKAITAAQLYLQVLIPGAPWLRIRIPSSMLWFVDLRASFVT